jgi:hypothetical protein
MTTLAGNTIVDKSIILIVDFSTPLFINRFRCHMALVEHQLTDAW